MASSFRHPGSEQSTKTKKNPLRKNSILRGVRKAAEGERGQALLEYIILLSIVLGIMGYFLRAMSGSYDKTAAGMGGRLEKQLRTGSAPASVWTK